MGSMVLCTALGLSALRHGLVTLRPLYWDVGDPRSSHFSRRAGPGWAPKGMDSVEFQVRDTLQPASEPRVAGQGLRLGLSPEESQGRVCGQGL